MSDLKDLPTQGRRREVQDEDERVIPVVVLADPRGNPAPHDLDAFGSLRVSSPYTLADLIPLYGIEAINAHRSLLLRS